MRVAFKSLDYCPILAVFAEGGTGMELNTTTVTILFHFFVSTLTHIRKEVLSSCLGVAPKSKYSAHKAPAKDSDRPIFLPEDKQKIYSVNTLLADSYPEGTRDLIVMQFISFHKTRQIDIYKYRIRQ